MSMNAEKIREFMSNRNVQIVAICLLVLLMNIFDISKGELFFNNDEPRHAFNGVFIYDLLRDLPLDPIQYAYEYYAQYPALSIIHWPPFFYVEEAAFYALFGISVEAARLSVLFFALIGSIYWYKLILKMYNMNIAFFSSVLLITAQPILLYSKMVMLEIPSLALIIISIYYYYKYIVDRERKDVYWCSIFMALAILTKQNAIFLPLLFIAHSVFNSKYDLLKVRDVWISIIIFILLITPYNLFVLHHTASSVAKDLLQGTSDNAGSIYSLGTYLYYLKVLPEQVGWGLLGIFVLSMGQLLVRKQVRDNSLPLLWIVVCYIVFTLISQKSSRYIIYWVPPVILFSVIAIDSISLKIRKISFSIVVLAVISLLQIACAFENEKPFISGYEKAAESVLEKMDNGILFFDGYYDANFIFYIRKHDKDRNVVVIRGSKAMFTTNIYPEYDIKHIMDNQREIDQYIQDYGIKYIIVEDIIKGNLQVNITLRRLLNDGSKFRLISTVGVDSNLKDNENKSILIYENKRDVERRKKAISFKMLTLNGKDISLDLDKKAGN